MLLTPFSHIKSECTINRLTHGLADLSVEDAWKALEQSDYEREVDEIKAVCRQEEIHGVTCATC